MMDCNHIYYWKEFVNAEYRDIELIQQSEIPNLEFRAINENIDLSGFSFSKPIKTISLPQQIKNKFEQLFCKYQISEFSNQLISFGAVLQSTYINNIHDTDDPLLRDFDLESKELEKLLDCLENFIFEKNRKDLYSIQFTFQRNKPISLKNYFVVSDIYSAICQGFDISKENFAERKIELLSKTNQFKVHLHSEYTKSVGIQFLFEILNENIKINSKLRFVGAFLSLCFITTNNKNLEFNNSSNLEDLLKSIDLHNLNHYIKRPKNYLH